MEPQLYKEPAEFRAVNIATIDHSDQRYETAGDYYSQGDIDFIRVSKTRPHYEFLIALHEFVEKYLVQCKDLALSEIDQYDQLFENMRTTYPSIVGDKEPGDDPSAPYHKEHGVANYIEGYLINVLKIDREDYEKTINGLHQKESKN